MSTPLSGGLATHFAYVFTVLLAFLILYGILSVTKVLSENNGLNALIALVASLLLFLFPKLINVIDLLIPWFTLLFIIGILILLFTGIFGADKNLIKAEFTKGGTIITVIIVLSIIVILGAFTKVFGGLSELRQNYSVVRIITHPYVLGAFAVLLIGAMAIRLLTELKID